MHTALAQRWLFGRSSFRRDRESINPSQYVVDEVLDAPAKAFVLAHHYAGSYPAARIRYALRHNARIVGVAVFSVPTNPRTFDCLGSAKDAGVELGRFVLLDEVPANGETWFLGQCFRKLRVEGFAGVVSFSDPVPRRREDGTIVFPGHIGGIYQAHNALYVGRSARRVHRILTDGRLVSPRSLQKIRTRERGWQYAVATLEAAGAPPFDPADPRGWIRRALSATTRRLPHPGNHKYVWALRRSVRAELPPALPYPKVLR